MGLLNGFPAVTPSSGDYFRRFGPPRPKRHSKCSERRDLLQFRPSTDDERELVDEFFEYMIAEGGDWHDSCCFSEP